MKSHFSGSLRERGKQSTTNSIHLRLNPLNPHPSVSYITTTAVKSERLIGCLTIDRPRNMPAEILWFQRGSLRLGGTVVLLLRAPAVTGEPANRPNKALLAESLAFKAFELPLAATPERILYSKALLSKCVNESTQRFFIWPFVLT